MAAMRCSRLLLFVVLVTLLGTTRLGQAQDTSLVPIIALTPENDLYAVSPADGSATLLLDRDPEQDALLEANGRLADLVLGQVSPGGDYVAYSAPLYEILDPFYSNQQDDLLRLLPRDIYLLNIETGEQTPVTDLAETLPNAVTQGSVPLYRTFFWSAAGDRLYYTNARPRSTDQEAQFTLDYFDPASGETGTLTQLDPNVSYFYPLQIGVMTIALTLGEPIDDMMDITIYGEDGSILEQYEFPNPALDLLYPIDFDPFEYEGREAIAFMDIAGDDDTIHLLYPETGEFTPIPLYPTPALTSRTQDEGLYASVIGLSDRLSTATTYRWYVVEADGMGNYPVFAARGQVTQVVPAPDGSAIAYIDPLTDEITLVNREEARGLSFEAAAIAWGAPLYTVVNIPG